MSDKKYIIVESSLGIDNLVDQVNDLMKKGYVPIGGVFATTFNYGTFGGFAQAMYLP